MTPQEVIKNLSGMKQMECFTCMHPQEVGWCENNCHKDEIYDTAIESLEKQIPKNAEFETEEGEYAIFLCPNCKRIFHNHIDEPQYCDECGQAIDWSDTE